MTSWVEWKLWRRILLIAVLGSIAGAVVVAVGLTIIMFAASGRPVHSAELQSMIGFVGFGLLIGVPRALIIGVSTALVAIAGGTIGKRLSPEAELRLTAIGGGAVTVANATLWPSAVGGGMGVPLVVVVGALATIAFTLATRNYRRTAHAARLKNDSPPLVAGEGSH